MDDDYDPLDTGIDLNINMYSIISKYLIPIAVILLVGCIAVATLLMIFGRL